MVLLANTEKSHIHYYKIRVYELCSVYNIQNADYIDNLDSLKCTTLTALTVITLGVCLVSFR